MHAMEALNGLADAISRLRTACGDGKSYKSYLEDASKVLEAAQTALDTLRKLVSGLHARLQDWGSCHGRAASARQPQRHSIRTCPCDARPSRDPGRTPLSAAAAQATCMALHDLEEASAQVRPPLPSCGLSHPPGPVPLWA